MPVWVRDQRLKGTGKLQGSKKVGQQHPHADQGLDPGSHRLLCQSAGAAIMRSPTRGGFEQLTLFLPVLEC